MFCPWGSPSPSNPLSQGMSLETEAKPVISPTLGSLLN